MATVLSSTDERDLQNVIANFSTILTQARTDWAKFKAGVVNGLFAPNSSERRDVINWFTEFPKLWDAIRPNYEQKTGDGRIDAELSNIRQNADAFVGKLRSDAEIANNLGIAPIIIAGILIAAAFGIAGAIWAVGYVKKQGNISRMIDNVVAGKLPAEVLDAAIKQENAGTGFLGSMTDLLKWAAIGTALVLVWPVVQSLFKTTQTVKVK